MRKLSVPLDSTINQRYDIAGYGFYIEDYPYGLEGYIQAEGFDIREISAQRIVKYPSRFPSFVLLTFTQHTSKKLTLWVIETESEFYNLPNETQYINVNIEGNVATEDTLLDVYTVLNTRLSSIDTKVDKVDTDNIQSKILSVISQGNGFTYCKSGNSNYDLIIENPVDSQHVLMVAKISLSNVGSGNITINIYHNSTYTGTPNNLAFANMLLGSSKTPSFFAKDITGLSITPGTELMTITLPSGKYENSESQIFMVNPNNTIHISVSTTVDYILSISIIET